MRQFNIVIRSLAEVQQFVSLATVQPFDVLIGNEHQQINAKNFMSMFSLDLHSPLHVSIQCNDEDYHKFRKDIAQFLV